MVKSETYHDLAPPQSAIHCNQIQKLKFNQIYKTIFNLCFFLSGSDDSDFDGLFFYFFLFFLLLSKNFLYLFLFIHLKYILQNSFSLISFEQSFTILSTHKWVKWWLAITVSLFSYVNYFIDIIVSFCLVIFTTCIISFYFWIANNI